MFKIYKTRPCFFRQSSVDSVASKSIPRYYELQHMQQFPFSPIFQRDGALAHTYNTIREHLT